MLDCSSRAPVFLSCPLGAPSDTVPEPDWPSVFEETLSISSEGESNHGEGDWEGTGRASSSFPFKALIRRTPTIALGDWSGINNQDQRSVEESTCLSTLRKSGSRGQRVAPLPLPSAALQDEVCAILGRALEVPMATAANSGLGVRQYFLGWAFFVLGGTGAGFGAGLGSTPMEGAPTAGYTNLIPTVLGMLRVGDMVGTHDGFLAANAASANEVKACIDHLNAGWGLRQLERIEAKLDTTTPQGKADLEFMDQARRQLRGQLERTQSKFTAQLSKDRMKFRCLLSEIRDVGLSSASCGMTAMAMAANIMKANSHAAGLKGALVGSAEQFAAALPFLSGALGILSGGLNLWQGILETHHASSDMAALAAEDAFDKDVFAEYGLDCQEMLLLMGFRHDLRELQHWKEVWLKAHGVLRAVLGSTGIAIGITSLVLATVASGAVSVAGMGIPSIVMGVVVATYLVWTNVRVSKMLDAQKAYLKAQQGVGQANRVDQGGMPGLSAKACGMSAQDIAAVLAQCLGVANDACKDGEAGKDGEVAKKGRGGNEKLEKALLALGMPRDAIHSAPHDNGQELSKYLGLRSAEAKYREMYRRSDNAMLRLDVVQAWNAQRAQEVVRGEIDEPLATKRVPWSHWLASGRDMANLCKSAFTRKRVEQHWEDEKLRARFERFLLPAGGSSIQTAEEAWALLEKRRAADAMQEKAAHAVDGWVRGAHFGKIEACLRSTKKDAFTLVCQQQLQNDWALQPGATVRSRYIQEWVGLQLSRHHELRTDNVELFMAASRKCPDLSPSKAALVSKVQAFIELSCSGMEEDEKKAFSAAVLKTHDKVSAWNLDAVLGRLQKFLVAADKLRRQTLTKVVASLYEYPTDGSIPKATARAAALRELRMRAPSSENNADIDHAVVLAKALSNEKLHARCWGAGEGGGALGFGGYELNEKGRLIRELMERSTGRAPTGSVLTGELLKTLWDKSDAPVYRKALAYWAQKLGGLPAKAADRWRRPDVETLALSLDLLQRPGALEKALETSAHPAWSAAVVSLEARLDKLVTQLGQDIGMLDNPLQRAVFDPPAFARRLMEFGSWAALAKKHRVPVPVLDAGVTLGDRLAFFRAALEWPNQTACAKNLRAIEFELGCLRDGRKDVANRFWSASFLDAQIAAVDKVGQTARADAVPSQLELLCRENPWLKGAENLSYKQVVKRLNELEAMSSKTLRRAIRDQESVALEWVHRIFARHQLVLEDELTRRPTMLKDLRLAANEDEAALFKLLGKLISAMTDERFAREYTPNYEPLSPRALEDMSTGGVRPTLADRRPTDESTWAGNGIRSGRGMVVFQ